MCSLKGEMCSVFSLQGDFASIRGSGCPWSTRRLTHRQGRRILAQPQLVQSHQFAGGLLKKHNPASYSSAVSRGEQMLQHQWIIRQGNVACPSVWPGQWTGCSQATHSVFLSFSWAVCEMCVLCVCVCPCVSQTLGGTRAGSCSYFGEVFVVALLGALKVVTH